MFFILCYTAGKIRHKKVLEKENGKIAKAQRYAMATILSAQKMLRGLTDKTAGKTRKEVVEFLEKDIVKALEQGHSLQDIQGILARAGIQAPLSRMKAVLGQASEVPAQKSAEISPQEVMPVIRNEPAAEQRTAKKEADFSDI
jgi:hypothetical protein